MIFGVAIVIGSVLAALTCSAFQLYSSRLENSEKRIDRKQMFLILIVLLDIPCVFLPLIMSALAPVYIYAMPWLVLLGGVIPIFVGGWVALRKGPIRISLSLACLILIVIGSFELWTFWILPRFALHGW